MDLKQQKKQNAYIKYTPRKFDVYIIESPSPKDLLFGDSEGESLSKTLRLSRISSHNHLVIDKKTFYFVFKEGLITYFKYNNITPIIHISAHGNKRGIQLSNGDIVSWQELRNILKPINKVLKGNLLLCMSTCEGLSACTMAMGDDDFPFLRIISNTSKPTWSETNIAFSTFYHLYSRGEKLRNAVYAMRKASGNRYFRQVGAEIARKIYLEYIASKPAIKTIQQLAPQQTSKANNK